MLVVVVGVGVGVLEVVVVVYFLLKTSVVAVPMAVAA